MAVQVKEKAKLPSLCVPPVSANVCVRGIALLLGHSAHGATVCDLLP